jgi:hypothetical protein
MGSSVVEEISSLERWWYQFDALMMKNIYLLNARFMSLLVVTLSGGGGVLLVELLRYQVERANGGGGQEAADIAGGLIVSIMVTLATLVHMNTVPVPRPAPVKAPLWRSQVLY